MTRNPMALCAAKLIVNHGIRLANNWSRRGVKPLLR
jgi:hypothetical protein